MADPLLHWELCDTTPAKKLQLLSKIRVRHADDTPFTAADLQSPMLVVINGEDELFTGMTVGDVPAGEMTPFSPVGGPIERVKLVQALMMPDGMTLEVTVGRPLNTKAIVEREVRDVTRDEAVAWFAANAKNKWYPARWYGTAESEIMKARIDALVQQARDEGLTPSFVNLHEGGSHDATCRACDKNDADRGPYNAHLLSKRDDDLKVLFFGFPMVCGVCAESTEAIEVLIEEIWDRGRGLDDDVDEDGDDDELDDGPEDAVGEDAS